ncbi:MAG TPA: hypothetical protein VFY68_02350 [Nitrososphaeraceae archaeon]|nr:hypothetical protein [Nitrososphaeraceae archaeon]
MKKSTSTTIITALSFIFSISLISATAYAQQQQKDQAASFIEQNSSNTKQDLLSSNESSQTQLDIKRSGSQPSTKGPEEWFTGTVRIDPLFQCYI